MCQDFTHSMETRKEYTNPKTGVNYTFLHSLATVISNFRGGQLQPANLDVLEVKFLSRASKQCDTINQHGTHRPTLLTMTYRSFI